MGGGCVCLEWEWSGCHLKTIIIKLCFNRQQDISFADTYMVINYLGISVEDYIVCFILGPR